MTIHKIKSIKILGISTDEYIGTAGTIFYDDETGALKLSDGITYGGVDISSGNSTTSLPPQTNNSGKFLTTNGTTLSWSTISQEVGQGNWTFTGDTATVSGTTLQVGKNSSATITQEIPGGTVSQTTTNTSQVAIDASSIVITRSVNQVVDDGVTTATDEAGSVASIGNGSAYLKTYSEPDGPNNTEYAQVGTSGSYAYLESRQDDLGGFTLGSVVAAPGTVSVTTHSTEDKTWLFDQTGILTLPAGGDIVDSTGTSVLGTPTILDGGNASTVF